MLLSYSATDTGDRLFRAILMGDHCIDITLDDNHLLLKLDGFPCHIQSIQNRIFFKEHRLGRIEILWRLVTQGTTTKADHSPPYITDWKDDTIAKVIIDSTTLPTLALP